MIWVRYYIRVHHIAGTIMVRGHLRRLPLYKGGKW